MLDGFTLGAIRDAITAGTENIWFQNVPNDDGTNSIRVIDANTGVEIGASRWFDRDNDDDYTDALLWFDDVHTSFKAHRPD